ncbi:MAG: TetR/AcrR family transcriptional regulator [Actinobacteria bacterium]|nr:TetR/AcrR family transcriptional regulator [Actinomycetota bacterium]
MAPRLVAQSLREKVIKAAVKYIADFGPDGLSFRQIAADAGVSHQAPYHHFADRSAIFAEIALLGFRKFTATMSAPARADDDPDQVVRLCERYVDFPNGLQMTPSTLCFWQLDRFLATRHRSTKFEFKPLRCGRLRMVWQHC